VGPVTLIKWWEREREGGGAAYEKSPNAQENCNAQEHAD